MSTDTLDGWQYSFHEVEGWPYYLYFWLGLRTAKSEERVVWIEGGTHARFLQLIEHLNDNSRLFRYTPLTEEA